MHSALFRDVASVHVEAQPDRVAELLREPGVLRAVDPRLGPTEPLAVESHGNRVDIQDRGGHVVFSFTVEAEHEGTRIVALENVRPGTRREAGQHMLFPGRMHATLQQELDRLKGLLEALGHR